MNRHTLLNISAMTAIGLAALAGSAVGQETGEHKLISPQDIKWGPAPLSENFENWDNFVNKWAISGDDIARDQHTK